jgi:hypothetical protein
MGGFPLYTEKNLIYREYLFQTAVLFAVFQQIFFRFPKPDGIHGNMLRQ